MKYRIKEIEKIELPDKLKHIPKPPEKIYYIGDKKLLYNDSFAIIGSRKVSDYGVQNCRYFTKELVLRNVITVSGMAIGTDTIVHEETLNNFGKTIAVLGCGLNHIYPEKNEELFYRIINSGGLVISEYMPNEKVQKEFFPARNRIISAVSEGILIIEAAYRSGTSITARHAYSQGKKVFAVPGRLGSTVGVGVNKLIKEGAILTTEIEDILEHYPQFDNKKRIESHHKVQLKKEYRKVYNILKDKEYSIEKLAMKTNMEIGELLPLITNMEIEDLIYRDTFGRYKLVERSLK